jgi:hypothetical protein
MTQDKLNEFIKRTKGSEVFKNGILIATSYRDVLEYEPITELYLIAVLCDEIDELENNIAELTSHNPTMYKVVE